MASRVLKIKNEALNSDLTKKLSRNLTSFGLKSLAKTKKRLLFAVRSAHYCVLFTIASFMCEPIYGGRQWDRIVFVHVYADDRQMN